MGRFLSASTDRTALETEILRDAAHIHRRQDQGHGKEGWFKPMHVGGQDASPHSGILAAMVKKGWMERRYWGRAYAYRITDAGLLEVESRKA